MVGGWLGTPPLSMGDWWVGGNEEKQLGACTGGDMGDGWSTAFPFVISNPPTSNQAKPSAKVWVYSCILGRQEEIKASTLHG